MDMVEGLRKEMSVPLIISGNIYRLDDAVRSMRITGADAVMIARGGVGNPFLLTQIDRYTRTGERLKNPTVSQQVDWCLQFMDMLIDEKGEDQAMRKMHCYAPRFVAGCSNGRRYRFELAIGTYSKQKILDVLERIRTEIGDEHIFSNERTADESSI